LIRIIGFKSLKSLVLLLSLGVAHAGEAFKSGVCHNGLPSPACSLLIELNQTSLPGSVVVGEKEALNLWGNPDFKVTPPVYVLLSNSPSQDFLEFSADKDIFIISTKVHPSSLISTGNRLVDHENSFLWLLGYAQESLQHEPTMELVDHPVYLKKSERPAAAFRTMRNSDVVIVGDDISALSPKSRPYFLRYLFKSGRLTITAHNHNYSGGGSAIEVACDIQNFAKNISTRIKKLEKVSLCTETSISFNENMLRKLGSRNTTDLKTLLTFNR